jgi:DNA-binding transcriptional LysR family regulator
MELKHLKSFLYVAEQLSFVRAAQRLHLSQPALSSQIQRLEEELGVTLLARNRRTVKLTDAGTVFLAEARETLARAEQAAERAQRAARGEIGRLSIGFVFSAGMGIVPNICMEYRRKHPDVILDLNSAGTHEQIGWLSDKSVDVGFLRRPITNDRLKLTTLQREPFVALLPKSHPLTKQRQVSVKKLRDERMVAYGRMWSPGCYDAVLEICAEEGFTPKFMHETDEIYVAVALVAAGAGIAVLPKSIALTQSKDTVVRPLDREPLFSEIAIAIRREDDSPLLKSFVDLAVSYCHRHP